MLDEAERDGGGALVAAAREQARRRTALCGATARPVALAAAALGVGGLALAGRSGVRRLGGRASPGFAPAGKDLAWSSPAVLAGSPPRRFYSGRDPKRAATIEDLRAMAHRRLPRFVLEYLEGGAEGEACLARNLEALAEWRFTAPLAGRCVASRYLDRAVRPPHGDAGRDRADRPQRHHVGAGRSAARRRRRPKPAFRSRRARCRTRGWSASHRCRGCATGGSSTCSARRRSART